VAHAARGALTSGKIVVNGGRQEWIASTVLPPVSPYRRTVMWSAVALGPWSVTMSTAVPVSLRKRTSLPGYPMVASRPAGYFENHSVCGELATLGGRDLRLVGTSSRPLKKIAL